MWPFPQSAAVRSLFLVADALFCPSLILALALGVPPRPALSDLRIEYFSTYVGKDYSRDLAFGQNVLAMVKRARSTTAGTIG